VPVSGRSFPRGSRAALAATIVAALIVGGCSDVTELLKPARQVAILNASFREARVLWESTDRKGFGSAGAQIIPGCGRLDLPLQPGDYKFSVRSTGGPIRFHLPVPEDPAEPVSTIAVQHDGWVLLTLAEFLLPRSCGRPGDTT
jgi:hypothetical protein